MFFQKECFNCPSSSIGQDTSVFSLEHIELPLAGVNYTNILPLLLLPFLSLLLALLMLLLRVNYTNILLLLLALLLRLLVLLLLVLLLLLLYIDFDMQAAFDDEPKQ